jgi:mono/diheme cytochrome c family protein
MPSPALRHLSDEDLDAIVSYIRSLDTGVVPDLPESRFGPLARFGLATGEFETAATAAADGSEAQQQIEAQLAMASTDEERRGAYITTIVCSECHGFDLAGGEFPDAVVPDLRMVLAYSDSAFMALMREGRAHDGRDIGMMGEVYQRMRGLPDQDIHAIRAFATARAAALAGGAVGADASAEPR